MDELQKRVIALQKRWSGFIWHREEFRRVVEMVRDDPRLNHCQSTYFQDSQLWIFDHLACGLHAEVVGSDPSAAQRIVDIAFEDYEAFLAQCGDPTHLGDRRTFAARWQQVVDASAPARA